MRALSAPEGSKIPPWKAGIQLSKSSSPASHRLHVRLQLVEGQLQHLPPAPQVVGVGCSQGLVCMGLKGQG